MDLVERLARFCQFITKVSLSTTIIYCYSDLLPEDITALLILSGVSNFNCYLQKSLFACHLNVSWTPDILYLMCAYHDLIFKGIELILSEDLSWDKHCKAITACTY